MYAKFQYKSIQNWLLQSNSSLWIANLTILNGSTYDPCSRMGSRARSILGNSLVVCLTADPTRGFARQSTDGFQGNDPPLFVGFDTIKYLLS